MHCQICWPTQHFCVTFICAFVCIELTHLKFNLVLKTFAIQKYLHVLETCRMKAANIWNAILRICLHHTQKLQQQQPSAALEFLHESVTQLHPHTSFVWTPLLLQASLRRLFTTHQKCILMFCEEHFFFLISNFFRNSNKICCCPGKAMLIAHVKSVQIVQK